MITYNFHKGIGLYARVIRLYSKYSHVSIVAGGYVYEALVKGGVIKTPVKEWCNDDVVRSVNLDNLSESEVIKFLDEQVGKDYDIVGVLSFLWRFLPAKIGAWYCSELAMVSLVKGLGIKEFDQKQTPEDFYYVMQLVK